MTGRILVIDDDEPSRELVRTIFRPHGLEVLAAPDGKTGLEMTGREHPQVVLLDLRLGDLDGLDVLERLHTAEPGLPVVMMTASRDVKPAVRATQLGAFDYLTKPIDHDEVVVVVRRALETYSLRTEVEELRRQVQSTAPTLASLMGPSAAVKRIGEQVDVVAASNFTVLILGETGSGKELVAQAVFQRSERRRRPFVALDCGAIPETLLESELFGHERGAFTGADRRKQGRLTVADGGTCFLDEIGNLPMTLQVKLLRVLESQEVQAVGAERPTRIDVRFVAATNHDLQDQAARGTFRSDLYFRLAQYTIALPPLRERPDDIAYLAQRFFDEAKVELRRPIEAILPAAMELLRGHPWPGNVRELRNVVRLAVLNTTALGLGPDAIRAALGIRVAEGAPAPAGASLKEVAERAATAAEREAIVAALRANGGNKTQAARALKTDPKTLHVKIKALGVRPSDFGS